MGPRRGRTLKCQGNGWACVRRGSPCWSSAWPWWRSWSGPLWAPPWASPAARRRRRPSWSSRSTGEGDRRGDRRTPGRRGTKLPPLQAPPPGCDLGFADWRATPRQAAAYYEEELAERGGEVESFPLGRNLQSEQPGDIVYRSVLQWVRNHVPVRHTIGSRKTSSNPRPSSEWMVARGGASSLPDGAPCLISSTSARRAILAGHSPSALPYPAP